VSGTATQTPLPQLAFLGRQGERVAVRLALEQATTDDTLGRLHGFVDNAANTLRNAAANRLESQARLAEIEALLQGDLLTGRQRARLEEEKGKIEVLPPVTDTFVLNQPAVNVRLLRGTTLEVVGEARLDPQSAALETTLPEDGWYVLEKTVEGDAEGVALLQTEGIYRWWNTA
jgi:hypothetical protein